MAATRRTRDQASYFDNGIGAGGGDSVARGAAVRYDSHLHRAAVHARRTRGSRRDSSPARSRSYPADRYFARKLQSTGQPGKPVPAETPRATSASWATPGSLYIGVGMYAVGRLAKVDRMADLGLHGTEALLHRSGHRQHPQGSRRTCDGPKLDIKDDRSFVFARGFKQGDVYRSFPSGHSAMGFAAAAAVTSETSKWWPNSTWYIAPVMYGGATMIAASRMYNNKHWASDVRDGRGDRHVRGHEGGALSPLAPGQPHRQVATAPARREEAGRQRGGGSVDRQTH